MELTLDSDQTELQQAARRFVADHPDAEWSRLADLGWLGLAIPESHRGAGASRSDMAVIFEELGRGAVPGPIFTTAVLAVDLLSALAPAWCDELLPLIADGSARIAVIPDGLFRAGTGPAFDAQGQLSGTVDVLSADDGCTHYLVVSDTRCALVDAAHVAIERHHGFVPEALTAHFSAAPARTQEIDQAAALAAVMRATPILCAYQVGSCQAVFEMSVAYSGERMQFGKAIGTFQRVQDHIIDLVNATESARWATNYAVWRTDATDSSAHDIATAVHVAKSVTATSHLDACTSAHEVHAGIGVDLQYPLPRHTHASRSLYSYLGDPRWHRRRLTVELDLRP
ncbi:MAG TPA: acyl-CoA dehydrogenase family protein [Acidimicrobiales bacterium]|nr:acyl-CoA dehydrogenase family protein [Acidimicrobiales bacterium]